MTPSCFQNHMGAWAMHLAWFEAALSAVRSGLWKPAEGNARGVLQVTRGTRVTGEVVDASGGRWLVREPAGPARADVVVVSEEPAARDAAGYRVTDSGVAVIDVEGPLQKQASKWGGTSTIELRGALRKARDDQRVRAVLLRIDSPGGHVAGTHEAAQEVLATRKVKPVHAHIEDLGASAAYWIASQAGRVTANAAAEVGSIGVFAWLVDDSKQAELLGVRTIVVATGPHKGVGLPGQSITEEQLAPIREGVQAVADLFFAAVQKGRRLTDARLAEVTTGRTWPAAAAVDARLVDEVTTLEGAVAAAADDAGSRASSRGRRAQELAEHELGLRAFLNEEPKV